MQILVLHLEETNLIFFFHYNRKPTVNGYPVKDFEPYKLNNFNFLNITHEGLIMGKSPNNRRTEFYDYFIAEAKKLIKAHGDEPKQTVIEQFCERFQL